MRNGTALSAAPRQHHPVAAFDDHLFPINETGPSDVGFSLGHLRNQKPIGRHGNGEGVLLLGYMRNEHK
jgi:hypothetical protein